MVHILSLHIILYILVCFKYLKSLQNYKYFLYFTFHNLSSSLKYWIQDSTWLCDKLVYVWQPFFLVTVILGLYLSNPFSKQPCVTNYNNDIFLNSVLFIHRWKIQWNLKKKLRKSFFCSENSGKKHFFFFSKKRLL